MRFDFLWKYVKEFIYLQYILTYKNEIVLVFLFVPLQLLRDHSEKDLIESKEIFCLKTFFPKKDLFELNKICLIQPKYLRNK